MLKSWKVYALSFGIGFIVAGVIAWILFSSMSGRLSASLTEAKSALVKSQADYRQLSDNNKALQRQLDGADKQLTGQRKTIAEQQKELARLQFIIGQTESGLANIEHSVTSAGGDILATARNIASAFDQLFKVYNPSATAGEGSGATK